MTIQFITDKPIFLQLTEKILNSILKGNLKEGEFTPHSVRKLYSQFELNPNTVMYSTKILVKDDILEKKREMQIKSGALNKLI